MAKDFGDVPASSVLPIRFGTYGNSDPASITMSGLAVTDIEIYKGTSMTQRASDNGVTLLDTDGTDIDGTTGIHGFSVDLSDNSDSGFYAAASFYEVVVSSITVDSKVVNFIAATFRIVAAESIAGYPKSDVHALKGDAQSATDLQDFADAGYDPATNKVQGVVLVDTLTTYTGNTPQTGDSFVRIGATGSGLTSLAQASGVVISGTLTTLDAQWAKIQKWLRLGFRGDAAIATDHATELTEINDNQGSGFGSYTPVDHGLVVQGNYAGTTSVSLGLVKAKTDFLPSATAGAAGGVFIAGTNAATTVNITGTVSGNSTHSAVDVWTSGPRTLTAFGFTVTTSDAASIAAILDDTNELQADWVNGGRLDQILDARASQTSVDNLPTNGELLAAFSTSDGATLEAIATRATPADVNAQVLDVLTVDTFAELGAVPAATSTLKDAIRWVFQWFRNKATETATQRKLYADDGTTVISTETVSDDGTTFTKGEAS